MNKAQAGVVLLKIKAAFPFFDLNDNAKSLWTEKLMKADDQTVLRNLDEWIDTQSKAPHIADIIKSKEKENFDYYRINKEREAEETRLKLEAYNADNEVGPPDPETAARLIALRERAKEKRR